MAHFYGTLQGNRGQASRMGTKKSGLDSVTASWQGAVKVELFQKNGRDWTRVSLIPWQGKGVHRTLYNGPVSGDETTDL